MAPSSPFIQNQFIFPAHKRISLGAASLLGLSLFFGFNPISLPLNPSVVLAQEDVVKEDLAAKEAETYLGRVREDLKEIGKPGMSQSKKEAIEKSLAKVRELNHPHAIGQLLELLDSPFLDYGKYEELYEPLLDTLLSILESNKDKRFKKLVIKRYWKKEYVTFYEFPSNIRIGDIPHLLLKEIVRRVELEKNKKVPAQNVLDLVSPELFSQSFRLCAKAGSRNLFPELDWNLFERAVTLIKEVGQFASAEGEYVRASLVLGLAQALAEIPEKKAILLFLNLENAFNRGGDFVRKVKPEPYFKSARVQLMQRLLATAKLNPGAIAPTPEKAKETKEEIVEIPRSSPWLWLFLSAASILSGLGGYWFLIHSNHSKRSQPKPQKPKKRVPVDTVTAETIRFSGEEAALSEKKVGPFVLGNVLEKTERGVIREATVTNQNQTKRIKIKEIGNLLIPVAPKEKVSPNQPQVAFEINEETSKTVIAKKIIKEVGDLLIESDPSEQLESIAPILGKAHRAFSISENKWLTVTPFVVGENETYWLTKKLGQGGMGEVYKALDPSMDRYVAVKINLSSDPQDKERFQLEAKAAASVSHKNVVATYRSGASPVSFIMMELLHGVSLEKVTEELTLEKILEVGLQATEGLKQIHQQGILHRDLKPANLFWVKEGDEDRIVLTDFGLARKGKGKGLTQSGEILGTPAYMPPEQATGEKVTIASDLYSMGAILYELTTGKAPYDGDNPMAVLLKINSKKDQAKRTPISRFRDDVPKEFQDLVDQAMAYEAKDRFQTAEEMQKALKQLQINLKRGKVTYLTKNAEQIKKGKIILALSAVVAALFLMIPIGRSFRAPRKITKEVVIEKEIVPTPWEELKNLNYDEAIATLSEEIKKFKLQQNQAVLRYYQLLLKQRKVQTDLKKEEALKLFESVLQDLNQVLQFKEIEEETRKNLEDLKKSLELLSRSDSPSEPPLQLQDPTAFDLAA